MNSEVQMHTDEAGTKTWCLNGKLHRIDAPAIEWVDGTKAWCLNGKLHRTDGAALEYADGTKEWFVNDVMYFDLNAWVRAALEYQGIEATQQMIEQKIQCMMHKDLLGE